MKEIKTLVLCSTRFAIPALQQLRHAGMLTAVAVPAMAAEIAEHAEAVLKGSNIPLIGIAEKDHNEQLIKIIRENHINLGLMLTFSYKLSPAVYSIPSFGFYNFHTTRNSLIPYVFLPS